MEDWNIWIGQTQEQSDMLPRSLLDRFRATFDSDERGDSAPHGIHWCLCQPEASTAELGRDGHPKRGGFMPPVPLPRRMWAASQVNFHAPMTAGAEINRRSTIAEISEKTGATGPLVFVTVDHETVADGVLAVTERQSIVYRDAPTATSPTGQPKDLADLSGWPIRRSFTPSEALLFRYSALTFNSHRIHYDHPYATGEEGYRGLVVHGPLIATLLMDLAARELDSHRLQKFSMRAQAPAFVGELLHLVGKISARMMTLSAISEDGRILMMADAEF
jgi:3-methylfumaryl-CoA hydratase